MRSLFSVSRIASSSVPGSSSMPLAASSSSDISNLLTSVGSASGYSFSMPARPAASIAEKAR